MKYIIKHIATALLVLVGMTMTAQVEDIVIIENETINTSSDPAPLTVRAGESITIKPTTWIQQGTIFSAMISEDAYIPVNLNNNENYVFTRVFESPITETELNDPTIGITNNSDVIESITYFDGLGRAKQQIGIKASPDKKDIVTHITYDDYERQNKQYLPFERQDIPLGSFNLVNVNDHINSYYKTKYENDFTGVTQANINPYSESIFEPSPLNRVLEQGAPGKDWKANKDVDTDHTIKFDWDTNTAREVFYFKVNFHQNNTEVPILVKDEYYDPNELYLTITKDENWKPGQTYPNDHTTKEYKDKLDRVILKRTYNQNSAHDTYYVYDNFGNLTYVIPPKVNLSPTDGVSPEELNELCYQYIYDYRNRLVEKKIPGKGWEYIIYNKLDQPILTQDAVQRPKKEWLFTKYDAFGRVVYSGLYEYPIVTTRAGLQHNINNAIDAPQFETKQESAITITDTPLYYSNRTFPGEGIKALHIINYYDDYQVGTIVTFNPANGAGTWEGMTPVANVKGLPTVSQIKVLGTNKWITAATYYDNKGRAWEAHEKNEYLDTEDWVLNKLDFVGKVLKTMSMHTKSGTTITTTDTFTYDHVGRLLGQTQQINNQTPENIVANTYDALGQLETKEVGGGLQTVDYTYNIRGWLKGINDVNTLGNDLFAFGINYNTTSINGSRALYNGNISETHWKTTNDNTKRSYQYRYDALNRLTVGSFLVDNNTNGGSAYYESMNYDKNGNITKLYRFDERGFHSMMDNLDYFYASNSNKLTSVNDEGDAKGFKDGNRFGPDYTYDTNGNMTTDKNKGITDIEYNHLNLPTNIYFGVNKKLNYIYDATGIKLMKVQSELERGEDEWTVIKDVVYAGNYVYENEDNLKFLNHSEGYIEPKSDGTYTYAYQFKDHLGNIRLSYSDKNKDGDIDVIPGSASSEIISEKNYYPFGLVHRGYNNVINGVDNNYKQYQSQEFHEDFGLNLHEWKYRFSDPAIGRFISIDPLAEDYRYNGVYNFAENRVIDGNELEGLEWQPVNAVGNNVAPNSDQIANYNWAGYDYSMTSGAISTKGFVTEGITSFSMTAKEGTVASGAIQGNNSAGTEGATFFSVDDNKSPVKEFSALSSKSLSFTGSMETFPSNANKEWASGDVTLTSLYENGKTLTDKSWTAISGPWGNGSLENGDYTTSNLRDNRTGSYANHGVGFTFDINPTFTTSRDELRFHPDGGTAGTLGCIGLTCGATGLRDFRTRVSNYLSNNTSINVNVNITNNPNNDGN